MKAVEPTDPEIRELLVQAWRLIESGNTTEAGNLLCLLPPDFPGTLNAQAVCSLCEGKAQRALDILRRLVFYGDGFAPYPEADPSWRANFLLALLKSGNTQGFTRSLDLLGLDDHPAMAALRGILPVKPKARGFAAAVTGMFKPKSPIVIPEGFPPGWPDSWLLVPTHPKASPQVAGAIVPPAPTPSIHGPSDSAPARSYDLFISYAHQGDDSSREAVIAFVERLHREMESDFRRQFNRDMEIFLDKEDIQDFDHWQVRCYRALRESRFFLACLSRTYLRSDACRWEWEEWCRHELDHGLVGQGVASLWFVRLEDLDSPGDTELLRAWKGDLLQRFHIQCHEWGRENPDAFLDEAARGELSRLTEHVAQRLRTLVADRARSGNLPWPNANFVGREPELARLREALLDAPTQKPVGLHGVGGMGKTALALAFAYGESDAFPGGCWLLRCENQERLLALFRSLVTDLNIELTDAEKLDDAAAVRRVFEVLRPRGPALFLLDNVDRPALLRPAQLEFLKGQQWVRLLCTTRLAPFDFERAGAAIRAIDLDRLPEDQAVELIRRYQPETHFISGEQEESARGIVRLVDGLALAVETAAIYLGQSDERIAPPQYKVDIRDYVRALGADLRGGGGKGVASQLREVTATLRPTLARLDAMTRAVLQISALVGPDGVALPWLREIAGKRHPKLLAAAAIGQSDPWIQIIRSLVGMRLFQPTAEPRVVTIHRILQRVLDAELSEDRDLLQHELENYVSRRDAVLEETTLWEDARWEIAPLEALAWFWNESVHPKTGWLMNQAGLRWRRLADWSRAEPLMRRALEIGEKSFGKKHPIVAGEFSNLAMLLQDTNRLSEAEPLIRRALEIDEKSYGKEHPAVARDLNNLAMLLQATNRLSEAEPLIRRALEIDEKSYGKGHPEVAKDLNNLAGWLEATNRLAEAEPLYRRALEIHEKSYGREHPTVAISLNNLALLLQATNRLTEAEPLFRRALGISEKSYGKEHPTVAIRLHNLARFLQAINRLTEAEPLYRRALEIDEKSYGREHPEVATDLNDLAMLLQATNRLAEAEPLFHRALEIDEKSYGREHTKVATVLYNLAMLLQDTNRLAEAEPLYRRALEIDERSYGGEHPQVAKDLNNLALLLKNTKRFAEAEPLYRRALEIDERSYGGEHPEVARDLNNLAVLLQVTNRLSEAEPLMRRHLEILLKSMRITGHPHPHLQDAIGNYGGLLNAMGKTRDEILSDLREMAPELFAG